MKKRDWVRILVHVHQPCMRVLTFVWLGKLTDG